MVYLRIKNKSSQAKAMIDFLKTMPFVEILDEKEPNEITKQAMKEAEEKMLESFDSAEELIKALNK